MNRKYIVLSFFIVLILAYLLVRPYLKVADYITEGDFLNYIHEHIDDSYDYSLRIEKTIENKKVIFFTCRDKNYSELLIRGCATFEEVSNGKYKADRWQTSGSANSDTMFIAINKDNVGTTLYKLFYGYIPSESNNWFSINNNGTISKIEMQKDKYFLEVYKMEASKGVSIAPIDGKW